MYKLILIHLCAFIFIHRRFLLFISEVAKVGVVKPSVVSTSCYLNHHTNFVFVTVDEYL